MDQLTQLLQDLPEYRRLLTAIAGGACPGALSGLAAVHRAHFAAALWKDADRPVILICGDEGEGRRLVQDLEALTKQTVPFLPAREFMFHPGTASRQWEHRRLGIFHALLAGEISLGVVTVEALLQRTIPPDQFAAACRALKVGDRADLTALAEHLTAIGYTRCDQVEGVGQFALRGGILDLYSAESDQPVRVEFWGDEIDSMGLFDPETQRRTKVLEQMTILPAGEVISQDPEGLPDPPDLALSRVYPTMATAADYLPPEALLLVSESPRVLDRAKSWQWQLEEDITALLESQVLSGKDLHFGRTLDQLFHRLADWPLVFLDSFTTASYPVPLKTLLSVTAKQLPGYGRSLEAAAEDLKAYQKEGFAVVVLAQSQRRADNLQSLLREQKVRAALDYSLHALPQPGRIVIAVGGLSSGLEYPQAKWAVLAEGTPPPPRRVRSRKQESARQKLESFSDLSPGDLVVHEHHGVGRFVGMVKMPVDGLDRDYVKLQFAGSDTLYVPALQLDLVSKYIGGGEDEGRKLSKLGGVEWEKSKKRAKKAAKDLAKGLIQLYAQRQRQPGFAFSPDSAWQREFEDDFDYEETDDQLKCVEEIKRDMERPTPMDRLLCGDVGYGKTEVAFRAIMKCVLDGKQAAILVPTTVLAQQHYLTALSRFEKFPVSIEMISRFRTAAQSRDILRRVEEGSVDLLIGTHKLLGKSLRFKDLGLLVVDEEQRFGVTHKERLKEMSRQVDVLILSATPIPRTLNMALSGLRDMSTLEEPPVNRQPVQTYVLEHNWPVLGDAMRRELERGGQVYYLHNRVETIDQCAARISQVLDGQGRIAVAHGKMDQEELGEIMSRMTDGEVDILVCTTIIETGIDLPNVNTLIIEDADQLGLAQLHQLRGRVGRSARRAAAYMTYQHGKVLSEVAAKRLEAIREFAAFGSGFKIAMRDLEIRGAGNLLGPEQSGFLMSVGYDMYLRLLEEAVLEEQGKPVVHPAECAADLAISAAIPDRYVPSPDQRMDLYRRIARVRTEADADDITDELIDRYGDPPRPVNNLIAIALLRQEAANCGISDISQKENLLRLKLPQPDFRQVAALCGQEKYRQRLLFAAGDSPHLALRLKKGDDVLRLARTVIADFAAAGEGAESPKEEGS